MYIRDFCGRLDRELQVCQERLGGLLALKTDLADIKEKFFAGGSNDKVAYLSSLRRYMTMSIDD